jgi:hypothetical protein
MKIRKTMAALALAVGMCASPFAFGDITGKVTLDGKPPEMKDIDMSGVAECAKMHPDPVQEQTVIVDDKGDLANVVVAIKPEEGKSLGGEVPKEPAVLDQHGCMYQPHVLAMMTGQEFVVKNDDNFLHNVHSLSVINPAFNFGQPTKDAGKKLEPLKAAEYFPVKCDVHPWMRAYIAVFENPYFAVTKEDGTYDIKTAGLPDGDYTLTFWHEKYADDPDNLPTEKITVKDGKAEAPEHKFKAETALAKPSDSTGATALLASSATTRPAAISCPMCKAGAPSMKKLMAEAK